MDIHLEQSAEVLIQRVKHFLMTELGLQLYQASDEELYVAFSYALREEIVTHWEANLQGIAQKKARTIYYISMEYLTGRFLSNNLGNLQALEVVQLATKKIGRDFKKIMWSEPDPGLGNGGLGRLAACFLDSLATQKYPAMGYGLRYQYGIFEQQLWNGVQVERPDCWLLRNNPWEFRRDAKAVGVRFNGRARLKTNRCGEAVQDLVDYEEVRALPYDIPIIGYSNNQDPFSVISLRLWSTKESPRNFQLQRYNAGDVSQASENTMLTDVLYPNDNHEMGKRVRLKQEFLLVSASIQDILRQHGVVYGDDYKSVADKVRIQINDTHPALVVAEMMVQLTEKYDMPWQEAWEITKTCTSYTNHTILSEALEQWDQGLMHNLIPRQYAVIEKINLELCNSVRRQFPNDEDRVRRMSILEHGKVRMANLSIYGSHHVNGVAALHSKIIKQSLFKDFYEFTPEKFTNVTNGVTQRRWLLHANPLLSQFLNERIGSDWITNFTEIKKIAQFAGDRKSQEQLLAIKKHNKERLIEMLQDSPIFRDEQGNLINQDLKLDPNSLFDMQVKRIHEYKRQLMNLLHVIMVYQDLLENPSSRSIKRTVIMGGKAAPGYEMAKGIVRLIHCVGKKINNDTRIKGALKLLFVENYCVSKAEVMIPAAELSEQISTAGLEASGTGNMKFSMNGALTIGTDDGANVEMREEVTDKWWPFLFGCSAEEIEDMKRKKNYNPWDMYNAHPKIKKVIDSLHDGTFAETPAEQECFRMIHASLMYGINGQAADRYFVLKDLPSYYEAQKNVDTLYQDPYKWAEYAIHNIAGMSKFSTDNSIKEYATRIWGIEPIEMDKNLLDDIKITYVMASQAICSVVSRKKDKKIG